MFWPVMFEAASSVGPEGPLKKMPILVLEIPGHTALKLLANDYTKRPFIAWDPDSVESDGFLGSGEGEDDPDSEESDFE